MITHSNEKISQKLKGMVKWLEWMSIAANKWYLGVLIDNRLNLNNHIKKLSEKCLKKLNVLKCLSYKNWALCTNQQLTEKLSDIQYQTLKIISKERGQVSNTFLHDFFSIQTFDQRLHELSSK